MITSLLNSSRVINREHTNCRQSCEQGCRLFVCMGTGDWGLGIG
ncbi:hypothetical protein [Nostoc sp. CMAA1605]|nr:hypothetical protein [Nostoc sp. CMAA1605]